MDTLHEPSTESGLRRPVRRELDLYRDQIAGIDAWNAARRIEEIREQAAEAAGRSREMRLDLARRMDVIRRQQQALIERTHEQLRSSAHLLHDVAPARAMVVHRNDWFKDKVIAGLTTGGIQVVARLENGADAVGVAVAEQPDLILVEDRLPMISGEDVIRQVRQFAPGTIVTAQAANDWEIAPLLEAGATTAFTRRVPPADVAHDLCLLLTG